jgi:large repetitive protein
VTTFTVTIWFSEAMNTSAIFEPVVFFSTPGENPSAALTVDIGSGQWTNGNQYYTFTSTVADLDIDIANVDMEITNARSGTGDALVPVVIANEFSIDQLIATPTAPDLVPDLGSSSTDDLTADDTPTFAVAVPLTGVEAGDTIDLIDTTNGNATVGTYIVQAGDIGNVVQVTTNVSLADGIHAIAARLPILPSIRGPGRRLRLRLRRLIRPPRS